MGYRPLTDSKWGIAPSPTPSGGNLPRSQGVSPLTDSKWVKSSSRSQWVSPPRRLQVGEIFLPITRGIAPSPTPSGGNLPPDHKGNWNNLEKMFQRMCG